MLILLGKSIAVHTETESASVVKTFSSNSLINNERTPLLSG
jgi:hypothetical protein